MTLKRGYKQLVADAAARVHTLSVAEAQAKLDDSGAVFVDIREAAELDREGTDSWRLQCASRHAGVLGGPREPLL